MPRAPEDTVVRRALKQAIMWIVLAGTIGAAAWVSGEVNEFGPPQSFDGTAIQLPKRWVPTDDHDGAEVIEVRERGDLRVARTLTVRRAALSLRALLRGPPSRTEQVTLQDGEPARINVIVRRIGSHPEIGAVSDIEIVAVFTPPGEQPLALSIAQRSYGSEKRDTRRNLDLMKRVLATVRFKGEQPRV